MALIKCTECGSELSDKASCCPNCGCPISTIISTNEANKKALQKTQIKKLSKIAVIILLIALLLFSLIKLVTRGDASGLYDKNEWGTSIEEIKEKYPDGNVIEDTDNENEASFSLFQDGFKGIKDVTSLISFEFKENGLNKISVFITRNDDSESSDSLMMESIIDKYIDLYGEPEDPDDISYNWTTKKSKIELVTADYVCLIRYEKLDD